MSRPEPRRVMAALALSLSFLALAQVVGTGRASDGTEDGRSYTDIIVALRTHGLDAQEHPALSFVEWQNPDPRSESLRYPSRLDWSSPLEAVEALERRATAAAVDIVEPRPATARMPETVAEPVARGRSDARPARPGGMKWSFVQRARLVVTAPRSHDFWAAPLTSTAPLRGDLCTLLARAASGLEGVVLSCTGHVRRPGSGEPATSSLAFDGPTTLADVVADFLVRNHGRANIVYVANELDTERGGRVLAVSVKVAGVVGAGAARCSTDASGSADESVAEDCDGGDEDCDGNVDEGC